jgi:hypothetical protein
VDVLVALQVWAVSEDSPAARAQQQQFREAIIDDMTWLMRYGDVSVVDGGTKGCLAQVAVQNRVAS